MIHMDRERILLIGDTQRQVHSALAEALPGASVQSVGDYFDAIAELAAGSYTAVLAAAEPIERRPEAAVKTLRRLIGDGRLLLFGQPAFEVLSRKMLDFGCDDYLITPPAGGELRQMFGRPPLRLIEAPAERDSHGGDASAEGPIVTLPPSAFSLLSGLPLAEILLDALLQHPASAVASAVAAMSRQLPPPARLIYLSPEAGPPEPPVDCVLWSHPVRCGNRDTAVLHLILPREDEDQSAAQGSDESPSAGRHFLSRLAHLCSVAAALEERHRKLQTLAITDDLTGVSNGRYFRHFLGGVIEKARVMRSAVTLLLFDIDNFKRYNDQYGHAVGDEILKQTAALMRRCVRDHDLVARVGGDEFAVVFWEKEGPRQPREGNPGVPGRPPQEPREVFERFKRLLATEAFRGLGSAGVGSLTASGGLAVYPWHAQDVDGLIRCADEDLMFRAKQSRRPDALILVGGDKSAGGAASCADVGPTE